LENLYLKSYLFKKDVSKNYYISFYIFCIYLITFPFLSKLNLINLFNRISLSDFLLIFAFIFILPNMSVKFKKSTLLILSSYLIIIIFTVLSLLIQMNKNYLDLLNPLRFFSIVILAVLLNSFSNVSIFKKIIVTSFLIGSLITSVISILQMLNIDFIWNITDKYYVDSIEKAYSSYTYRNRIAAVSFFPYNGNYLGAYMSISLIILLNYKRYYKAWIIFLLSFLFLVSLFSSLSLTSITSFFTSIVISIAIFAFLQKRIKKIYFYVFIFVIGILSLMLVINWDNFFDKFYRYFLRDGSSFIPGMQARIELWKKGILEIDSLKSFLFGISYSRYQFMDNFYLEILVAGGIIALLSFIFMIIFLIIKSNSIFKFASIMLFILLNIMASYGGYAPLLIGIILIFLDGKYKKNNEKYSIGY